MLRSAGSGLRSRSSSGADRPLRNPVGAIGWPAGARRRAPAPAARPGPGAQVQTWPPTLLRRLGPSPGAPSPASGFAAGGAGDTIDTWLILPVVICLSQRLSHACPSISNLYGETANGSLNQLSFI